MNSREKVKKIMDLSYNGAEGGAYWTGHPNTDSIPTMAKDWNIEPTREAIFEFLGDDCRWIPADPGFIDKTGKGAFNPSYGTDYKTLVGGRRCFADCESVADVEKYPWPDPESCDFSGVYAELEKHSDKAVFSGMWSPFFHVVADFFGMENYFIKMYECPEVVDAVTEKVVDFYVATNEKFFSEVGDRCDIMFFGNDFGTQRDLFISRDMFRRFILPSQKRLIDIGKKYNKKVMLHSCGSVFKIIPDLIDAGIDALHPLQAQAAGMYAESISQFKNDIAFVGGIDAQSFFVNSTPDQIRDEVFRVMDILGPNHIVSPSHEEILPNVPTANVRAISQAVRAYIRK